MEVKELRRVLNRSALNQIGGAPSSTVCSSWMAGRCNRNPCRFLHQSSTQSHPNTSEKKFLKPRPVLPDQGSRVWKHESLRKNSDVGPTTPSNSKEKPSQKTQLRICGYWFKGNCVNRDKCKDLHTWSYGEGFSLMVML